MAYISEAWHTSELLTRIYPTLQTGRNAVFAFSDDIHTRHILNITVKAAHTIWQIQTQSLSIQHSHTQNTLDEHSPFFNCEVASFFQQMFWSICKHVFEFVSLGYQKADFLIGPVDGWKILQSDHQTLWGRGMKRGNNAY